MLRRHALRLLASTVVVPVFGGLNASQLLALGRRVHSTARRSGAAGPEVLEAHQRATVVAAAERIVPRTDTPGATDARVAEFVDRMLADWYPPADRDRFLAGLGELDARAVRAHGSDFVACAPGAQTALLTALDDEVASLRRTNAAAAGQHWFATLKFLTVWGYCTSEPGQTALGLWPLPGRFDGCARV